MPNRQLPRATKILKGTFKKSQNPIAEPEPTAELYAKKPPAYLNKHAKKLWTDMAQECIDMGTLTVADWSAFTALCEAWGEYRESYDAVYYYTDDETGHRKRRTLGQYMAGRNSQTIPEYNAMHKALVEWRSLAALFGIGASNRNKIDLKQKTTTVSDTQRLLTEVGGE